MLFKKSIHKTKNFFLKTLQNLKTFLFGSYDKIPKTLFLNPLSCSSINQRSHQLDLIYSQFSNQSDSGHDQDNPDHLMKQTVQIIPLKTAIHNHNKHDISSSYEVAAKMKQVVAPMKVEPSYASSSYRYANDGTYMLAQKMRQLEMMELGDVDHALDVEEALHYYSRLSCPVYVDIVNEFFMDMYAEFLLPQPPISLCNSSRRLGPLKF